MIQKPRGMQDIYFDDAKKLSYLENIITEVLKTFNYSEIRTSMMESKELFIRSVGSETDIASKEMFEIIDRKNRKLVLRPEGTAPVARAIIENKLYLDEFMPLKLFYIGEMFRYERTQVGRYRQFNQLGVELYGPDDIYADLEIILVAQQLFSRLQIGSKTLLEINYLVSGDERVLYVEQLLKKLIKIDLCNDCQIRIKTNPLRVLDCKVDQDKFIDLPVMEDYLTKENKIRFNKIKEQLEKLNINYIVNSKLVRGLDYYTGFIFEFKYINDGLAAQSTILAGGRYNNLLSELGGPSLPAIGWAMGIERIMFVIENERIILSQSNELDFYFVLMNNDAKIKMQPIINQMRLNNFSIETNLMQRSLKSEFKKIENLKAKALIIIGDKELQTNQLIIKNQIDFSESVINIDGLLELSKKEHNE